MESIVTRIRAIIENEGYTPASFADTLGIGRPLLSHVLGGRNNPSLQLVMRILERFPSYSAQWLLYGATLEPAATSTQKDAEDSKPHTFEELPLANTPPVQLPIDYPKMMAEKHVNKSDLVRTMLFYADGTFEEYKPRN